VKIRAILIAMLLVLALGFSAGAADQVFFYHTDAAGTPMAMTDESGAVVWRAVYMPFGEENSIAGSAANNKRFAGKEKDAETGLSYFGARYEDPRTGRFISVDPVGAVDPRTSKTNEALLLNPQRLNPYAYALNNPYRYFDRDGREVKSTFDKDKGVVTTTDLDSGKTSIMRAKSGGKPFGKAIEKGEYDILNHPDVNFLRLEPKDEKYGNDVHDPTNRDKFRMHKPGNTVGCISAENIIQWEVTRDLIRNTKTTSQVEVDSKSRNPFAPKKEKIIKFGTLEVK